MAKRIEGVTEKLLECAKREFLEKGYQGASLRTITQNANTTTRAVYTRYSDKEGLFDELVAPVAAAFKKMIQRENDAFAQLAANKQKDTVLDKKVDEFSLIVDYIYDNFDAFKLLIVCSQGTAYANYINEVVEIDVEYTIKFLDSIDNDALSAGRASLELLHILSGSFFYGFFEPVVHDMDREHAKVYIQQLRGFFLRGWSNILAPAD